MIKIVLKFFDECLYNFIFKNVEIMPQRLVKLFAMYYPDARIRKLYFEKLGIFMGKNTYANLGMKVVIGERQENFLVEIGDNVSIGPNLTLIIDSRPNNSEELKNMQYIKEVLIKNDKIIIENDVWIGANVTIFPGIKIGKCSVIGAGSVVIKDIEPYSIYAGVPAKRIRKLN